MENGLPNKNPVRIDLPELSDTQETLGIILTGIDELRREDFRTVAAGFSGFIQPSQLEDTRPEADILTDFRAAARTASTENPPALTTMRAALKSWAVQKLHAAKLTG